MSNSRSRARLALTGVVALGALFLSTAASAAPTYGETVLHSFGTSTGEGTNPFENPLLQGVDGNLYGMTTEGGDNGTGTIFRMAPDGSVTTLHSFGPVDPQTQAGPDLASPSTNALMLASDGNYYATVRSGGNNIYGLGGIIKLTPDGQESVLYALQGDGSQEGYQPVGSLVQGADGALYGVTQWGGAESEGVIFKITLDGHYSVLHTFCEQLADGSYDDCRPNAGMILASDGNFYGTLLYDSGYDPYYNSGGIFRLSPNGDYTVMHKFGHDSLDGEFPSGALVQGADGALYGTTVTSVFRMTLDGQLSVLHTAEAPIQNVSAFGPDGAYDSTLVRGADGMLYGTSQSGGAYGQGLVFEIAPDGTFLPLDFFLGTAASAGQPTSGVILGGDGSLYGTSIKGGAADSGTIYRLDLPPPADWGSGAAPTVHAGLSTTTIHVKQKPYAILGWSASGADACAIEGNDSRQFGNGPIVVAAKGALVVHPAPSRNTVYYYDISCSHNGLVDVVETLPLTVTLN